MKNILLIKGNGVYGAIRNYIDEFERGFWALGYNTIILDAMAAGFEKRYQWILKNYSIYAVVDCQGMVLDLLSDNAYKEDVLYVHYCKVAASQCRLRLKYYLPDRTGYRRCRYLKQRMWDLYKRYEERYCIGC